MQFLKDRDGYFFTNRALVKLILPLIIEQLLAVLVGMADKFEIWDQACFDALLVEDVSDEVAACHLDIAL